MFKMKSLNKPSKKKFKNGSCTGVNFKTISRVAKYTVFSEFYRFF